MPVRSRVAALALVLPVGLLVPAGPARAEPTASVGVDGAELVGGNDDLPKLHGFAAGLERDLAAVTAGLTLPWSSGVVEGHVNRIKLLKRQMFGRAGFDLLRKRVLLAQ